MDEVFDFNSLVGLCRETHQTMRLRAARSINIELVVRNWLFGRYLVEYEQKGADRAEYGAGLLEKLSKELGKGFSIRSLRQFRQFYMHQNGFPPLCNSSGSFFGSKCGRNTFLAGKSGFKLSGC